MQLIMDFLFNQPYFYSLAQPGQTGKWPLKHKITKQDCVLKFIFVKP